MSLEVAGGPTIGLKSTVKLPLYEQEPSKNGDESSTTDQKRSGFFLEEIKEEEERSETSSIGACSSAEEREEEEEEEEEEVQSKEGLDQENKSSLSSLDSLEESLPIKRGLSSFYSGKSKSFTSLSNAANATAKDLIKPENPFNKRRRIQLMAAWSRTRRASCISLFSSSAESSLPPPPLLSECEEEEESIEEEVRPTSRREKGKKPSLFTCTPIPIWSDNEFENKQSSFGNNNKMPLKSPRSFSLSDLNKHGQD